MKRLPMIAALFGLSGCVCTPTPHSIVTPAVAVTPAAQSIQNITATLYQSDALNQVRPVLFTPKITANSQRITVDWDGDAIELLSQLAHMRGLSFAYTGVRLPLPLTLHASDVTFEQVLRLVRTQIDWRAQLEQQSHELRLFFMLPLKKGMPA
ncbi:DotD/TraH family lipoprotein [Serratia sp. CY68758]|uniref:DotD/TraH family lipoprotein n=1 Tax=Serratia TaxID=613 RepID=UPI001F53F708|nr:MULTISPECIES: DotD/TraH family lipoprotein [Serratia]